MSVSWQETIGTNIMSTKFFNNTLGNTLFDKLKGIASEMATFDRFLAVVGFFRSSGYFKLRKELGDISEIKILVGINIDDIFRKHNKTLLMLANEDKAKEIYHNGFKEDIVNAQYAPEVEEGILQMCEDLVSGRLQMRIHATKTCTPNSISVYHRIIVNTAMVGLLWVLQISLILV